jgi:putative colanic acid biosynthesis UDP-glucose lipid carrier transferase
MLRHKVTPGITGLAQVNGCRGETACLEDMVRRVQYDIEYMRRWCWLLDMRILFRTLVVVLFNRDHVY